jgi:hypothetical protein
VLVFHERKSRVTFAARLAGKTAAETIDLGAGDRSFFLQRYCHWALVVRHQPAVRPIKPPRATPLDLAELRAPPPERTQPGLQGRSGIGRLRSKSYPNLLAAQGVSMKLAMGRLSRAMGLSRPSRGRQ